MFSDQLSGAPWELRKHWLNCTRKSQGITVWTILFLPLVKCVVHVYVVCVCACAHAGMCVHLCVPPWGAHASLGTSNERTLAPRCAQSCCLILCRPQAPSSDTSPHPPSEPPPSSFLLPPFPHELVRSYRHSYTCVYCLYFLSISPSSTEVKVLASRTLQSLNRPSRIRETQSAPVQTAGPAGVSPAGL